jgi:hypothetical protein
VAVAGRIFAVLAVLLFSILTGAGSFVLLDAFHAPLVSGWDVGPGAIIVVALGAGLSLVFARFRAPLWEITVVVVLSLLVAFTAYAYMGIRYVCARETCARGHYSGPAWPSDEPRSIERGLHRSSLTSLYDRGLSESRAPQRPHVRSGRGTYMSNMPIPKR